MDKAGKTRQKASFAWLLRDTLGSLGIRYLTPENIRLSKTSTVEKNPEHTNLCALFWRAIYDLCMVYNADFDIDPNCLAEESQRLSEEVNGLQICIDVARHQLYSWGFTCYEFYTQRNATEVCGPVMLSALAFVLAFGDFFSRQATAIVRLQLSNDSVYLPPYPNEPELQLHQPDKFEAGAREYFQGNQFKSSMTIEYAVHRIHTDYGKMQHQLKELKALVDAHAKYLKRIRDVQIEQLGSVILLNEASIEESILTPFSLWLLKNPERLRLHIQALDKRIANYADEKLFYQWVLSCQSTTRQQSVEQEVENGDSNYLQDLLLAATNSNEAFQSQTMKEIYRTVSRQWKDMNSPGMGKHKAKLEIAAAKMSEELPSLDILYTPIAKPKPRSVKEIKAKTPPPRIVVEKSALEDDVLALLELIEKKHNVRLA